MTHLTIRRRILLSFLAVLAVLTAVAGTSYVWFRETERETLALETNTIPALVASLKMSKSWANAQGLLTAYALEQDPTARAELLARLKANRATIAEEMNAYVATIDSPEDQRIADELNAAAAQVWPAEDAAAGLPPDALRAIIRNDLVPRFATISRLLEDAVALNQKAEQFSADHIVEVVRNAETALYVGFVLAAALSVLCGWLLFRAVMNPLGRLVEIVATMRTGDFSSRIALERRDEFATLADGFNAMADELTGLIGQVQRSSIQVNTSITEIAATSKEQQATASEIAATTTEIGATAKEISATSNELVRTMTEVSHVADETASLAGGGQAGLARMEATMRQVMEAAGAINGKLAVLSEKAGNINQMVTTITKVADQTNLLSLNAAIEAEKAGQYGRGFAVVATEIRRLADQTAASTYDIEQMVRDIQSAVAAGVMGMDKFSEEVRRGMIEVQDVGAQLSSIIRQVQGLVPRFEVVNEGMQAQAAGAEQISDALVQLGEAAQQTVESLHQSSIAIDELNQVSGGLRSAITRFRLRA